jgi:predicted N-acetyltransferase YhbS
VPGWYPDELARLIRRLEARIDSGGVVLGAWAGDAIIGLGSLDITPVGGNPRVMKLDMLHVSRSHRGRGVGHTLTTALAERARARGATALYISATPTRATVDAYRAMGALIAPEPDPDLFRLEPEDIHLLLPI